MAPSIWGRRRQTHTKNVKLMGSTRSGSPIVLRASGLAIRMSCGASATRLAQITQ